MQLARPYMLCKNSIFTVNLEVFSFVLFSFLPLFLPLFFLPTVFFFPFVSQHRQFS